MGYGRFTAGWFEVLNAEKHAAMLSPGDPSGSRVDWDRQKSASWRRFALLLRISEIEAVPSQIDRLDRSGNWLRSILGEVVQTIVRRMYLLEFTSDNRANIETAETV